MVKCSFCEKTLEKGTGKMFVKKDGKILYFCSGKCEKGMLKLKRKPVKQKWIVKEKKSKSKTEGR